MTRPPESLRGAVRAFKQLTAAAFDASATRARVLSAASRRGDTRSPRRLALFIAAGILAAGSVGTAGSLLAGRWRYLVPIVVTDVASAVSPERSRLRHGGASPKIPPATIDPAANAADDAEAIAYGRAHRLHFARGAPLPALAAWNEYLRRFPGGAFAPEARFNRAVCLVRLGRLDDATAALRPFAAGEVGGYRRDEAARLIDWMARRAAPR